MTGNELRIVLALALSGAIAAQGKDLRDIVKLESGKEIRGRIYEEFGADELVLVQGGKRVRVPKSQVAEIDSVRNRLRAFLARRMTADDAAVHWALAEWASKRELDSMARLQALTVLELDDAHEQAHRFLGHRLRKSRWQWPVKSRWMTRDKYDEYIAEMGHPLVLDSEHFRLFTDGGIPRAVEALIDLERLYTFWFDAYGKRLQLAEALLPMDVQVWNDEKRFPGWTSVPIAYFVPNPYANRTYTFFRGTDRRSHDLFAVGTQHILYRCLARDADPGAPKDRYCDWLEIGLGQWIQRRAHGEPGRVEFGEHRFEQWEADTAYIGQLRNRYSRYIDIKNMLHWTLRTHFYGSVYERNLGMTTYWATAHLFVAFLMDEALEGKNAERLMNYLRVAVGEAKGDSSKAFDEAMETRIEDLEKPFREWLQNRASATVKR
jgi:hypothetical protein